MSISLGGLVRTAGRIGSGLATGGIIGGLTSAFGGGRSGAPSAPGFGGFQLPNLPGVPRVNGPGGIALPGFGGSTPTTCPKGYHLNKHALAASKRHGAVAARTTCVRNRKINPLNPRALTRALRREKRAGKIIKRLHVFRPIHHAQQRRLPARTR
jgi:hypothetical protein